MRDDVSIGVAARMLGVSVSSVRRMSDNGRLEFVITEGGHRRFSLLAIRSYLAGKGGGASEVERLSDKSKWTIGYARVGSQDHQPILDDISLTLRSACEKNSIVAEVITDVGGGVHSDLPGFRRLIGSITRGEVERLILPHRESLPRFAGEIVFALCSEHGVAVEILGMPVVNFDDDLRLDIAEMATLFTSRLYGYKSKPAGDLIAGLSEWLVACGRPGNGAAEKD